MSACTRCGTLCYCPILLYIDFAEHHIEYQFCSEDCLKKFVRRLK